MDETRKTLHRTSDGIIAGVAAGFAHALGIDPVIMRLVFVVLTVLTSGLFLLVYIALWLVLPKEDAKDAPVDVRPDSAESARNCACGEACKEAKAREGGPRRAVAAALAAGIVLVCFGMAALFCAISPRFHMQQFWPLFVVAFGVARLVLPARDGCYTVYGIVEGAVLCVVGTILLLTTTGVLLLRLGAWLGENWSLLAITAGLLILGHSLKSPVLVGAAVCVVAAFCIIGLSAYTFAGPANDVWMPVPYGQIAPDCRDAGGAAALAQAVPASGQQAVLEGAATVALA